MQHVDQLMNERRDDADLRSQGFYTADGEMYFLDGVSKAPTLAITREAQNPVLQNIDDAFQQLITAGSARRARRVKITPYRTAVPNEFKAHYDALLADPESAMKALDDKTAAGLLRIVASYSSAKEQ